MLIGSFDAVSRISGLVQRDEELLRVAIEATFPSLIRRDFDEGVVAAFLANAQLKIAEVAGEGTRAGGVATSLHSDLRKEFVGNSQHVYRHELGSEKMSHLVC